MKIPKSVNIMGDKYNVKLVNEMNIIPGALGVCDPETKTIYLMKTLKKDQMSVTFIHEIVHAVIVSGGLHQVIGDAVEEILCEQISRTLHKILD